MAIGLVGISCADQSEQEKEKEKKKLQVSDMARRSLHV
jgi:hypothetical protein